MSQAFRGALGAGREQGWHFCRRHDTSHGANKLPGEQFLWEEALGKGLKHVAFLQNFPLHPPSSCSTGSCSPLTLGLGGSSLERMIPVEANVAVPAQQKGAHPKALLHAPHRPTDASPTAGRQRARSSSQ